MTQVAESQSPGTHAGITPAPTGAAAAAHLARGKIIEARPGVVVFQPRGTNYELHLEARRDLTAPTNKPILGTVLVRARKVYTVPSGGNFIAPILGTPRTIQGRVVSVSPTHLVLQAGLPVRVELPTDAHAIDLGSGPIEEGAIVNVVAQPGAGFDLAPE